MKAVHLVGATGLEPAVSCSQSRRASHYATPRQARLRAVVRRPESLLGADDGNRTRVASLEDWGSTIELHPRAPGAVRARRSRAGAIVPHSGPPPPTGTVVGSRRSAGSEAVDEHQGAVVVARAECVDESVGAADEL